jgi:hypothetical protein
MSNKTTPTGRHRRGWERRKAHQGRKKDIGITRQKGRRIRKRMLELIIEITWGTA